MLSRALRRVVARASSSPAGAVWRPSLHRSAAVGAAAAATCGSEEGVSRWLVGRRTSTLRRAFARHQRAALSSSALVTAAATASAAATQRATTTTTTTATTATTATPATFTPSAVPGGATVIRGSAIAAEVHKQVAARVAAIKQASADGQTGPKLAVILVGDRKDSQSYVLGKTKAARAAGIDSVQYNLPATITQHDLHARLRALNADPSVNGILLQLPLPAHLNTQAAVNLIEPIKDVDGLTPTNVGRLVQYGLRAELLPCTPAGCIALLQRTEEHARAAHAEGKDKTKGGEPFQIAGAHAVVLGRSELVGRPIGLLLDALDATVTVAHSKTRNLPDLVRRADIVVAAVGRPGLVKASWLKPGAVVVDVGINAVPDPSKKAGHRLVGDVEYGAACQVASYITPVPGGVGPMTVATLLQNTVRAYELQHAHDHTLHRHF